MEQPNEIFVFFTSKYSNACKQIVEKLNYIAPHFNTRIVDIDNPDTRFVVQNATEYKIDTVPAALIIYPKQNSINKLEGLQLVQLLDKGVEMVNQKLMAIQEEEQRRLKSNRRKAVEIDGEEDDEPVYENKTTIKEALNIPDEDDEEDEVPRRRKIGKTHIFPDKRFSPIDDDDMISNSKPLPGVKGEGHESMAHSSLVEAPRYDKTNEMGMDRNMNYPPKMKQTAMMEDENQMIDDMSQMQSLKKGKKKKKMVTFDDSILDVSNVDDSSMGNETGGMSMDDILGPNGGAARSKELQERSSSLKQNAAALAAAREQIMKQEDGPSKVRVMA